MELLIVLLLLLLAAAIWAISSRGTSPSVDRAWRSSVEANRAAMRGETGSWRVEPSDTDRPVPPAIKTGRRGGRYTEARTKEGRPYRRYF